MSGSRMRMAVASLTVAVVALGGAAGPGAGAAGAGGGPAPGARLSTPALIRAAVVRGKLDAQEGLRLRALAFTAPDLLPAQFRSTVRWDGTLEALSVQAEARRLPAPLRRVVLGPAWPGESPVSPSAGHFCFLSVTPMPMSVTTPHFYVEYDPLRLAKSGIGIDVYLQALEQAWATEVDSFGWAPPPVYVAGADPRAPWAEPAPDGRYHVRVDVLPPGLYGQVSLVGRHAGNVRDNMATPWQDRDAHASCMMLNADFRSLSPDNPVGALRATVAHELHHALQGGIGAILEFDEGGSMTELDGHFVEATATAMEDEVFDDADDVHNQLWPAFEDDMGEHEGDPYRYWLTWRGLTERFGSGVPGGAEQVYQEVYERLSRQWGLLDAAEEAMATRDVPLADAFHDYAIAVRFLRECPPSAQWALCLEEGTAYAAAAGTPVPVAGSLAVGSSFTGSVPDNYALDHVAVPVGRFRLTAANTATGGVLRVTVACVDPQLRLVPLGRRLGAGESAVVDVDTTGCAEAFAIVTNEGRSGGANPASSVERAYRLEAGELAAVAS